MMTAGEGLGFKWWWRWFLAVMIIGKALSPAVQRYSTGFESGGGGCRREEQAFAMQCLRAMKLQGCSLQFILMITELMVRLVYCLPWACK